MPVASYPLDFCRSSDLYSGSLRCDCYTHPIPATGAHGSLRREPLSAACDPIRSATDHSANRDCPPRRPGTGPTPTVTPTGAPPPAVNLTEEPSLEQLPRQINILLLGADRRPYETGFRTDTIILLTLNSELGSVNVTSFPRDLWVMLPELGEQPDQHCFHLWWLPDVERNFPA